jgi:type IV secretory pathway VirB9-like protein
MKTMQIVLGMGLAFLVASPGYAQRAALQPPAGVQSKTARPSGEPPILALNSKTPDNVIVENGDAQAVPRFVRRSAGSYETVFDAKMAIPLWTIPRYQTTITLPTGEVILKANAADDNDWDVMFTKHANVLFVKPKFSNSGTSIQVLTQNRTMYIFNATSGVANGKHEAMILLDVLPAAWQKTLLEPGVAAGKSVNQGLGRAVKSDDSGSGSVPNAEAAAGDDDEGVPLPLVRKREEEAFKKGAKQGESQASKNRDEEFREFAASIFRNANLDYKWSGDTSSLRLIRAFDDGRVTYLVFDSALNIMPSFWEIVDGQRKNVSVTRTVFDPNIWVVGELFKDGVLLTSPKDEIKISNRGFVLKPVKDLDKVQVQGNRSLKPAA